MFVSVIVLVITAIPLWCLRYPYSEILTSMVSFFGELESIRIWHHWAGWMLTFAFCYHILYIMFHPEGRRDFLLMLPLKKDFNDLFQNVRYFLGKTDDRPKFGRFSYFEKFDYWAAFWGCVFMIGTGLIMLYNQKVTSFLPDSWSKRVFDVAVEAHFHEAILAALALFIWHLFNVHFNPKKFPGSLVWLHGKITEKDRQEEHPIEDEEIEKYRTFKEL